MRKRIFEDKDHVLIARSLSNVGTAYEHNGEFKKELEVILQAPDFFLGWETVLPFINVLNLFQDL